MEPLLDIFFTGSTNPRECIMIGGVRGTEHAVFLSFQTESIPMAETVTRVSGNRFSLCAHVCSAAVTAGLPKQRSRARRHALLDHGVPRRHSDCGCGPLPHVAAHAGRTRRVSTGRSSALGIHIIHWELISHPPAIFLYQPPCLPRTQRPPILLAQIA